MVLHIFAAMAGLVKLRETHTDVDSQVFRLHYRLTSAILFIACAFISATEYIGNPIQCFSKGGKADGFHATYCWISSTFTINSTDGLGNHHGSDSKETYHSYYQWVPFVLFIQACLFYLPHLLWKAVERKTADSVLQGLDYYTMDPDLEQKKENIIKYLRVTRGQNSKYSLVYHLFELLNMVNVVGQIFLLDDFFDGAFLKYGTRVLKFAIEDSSDDPFRATFPKQTKCFFTKIGSSGTPDDTDFQCILPQNILNEKVFVILWFWFVILATITGMQLAWRLAVMLSPVIRVRLLERKGKLVADGNIGRAIERLHLGDFFLLDIIGTNLSADIFSDILKVTLTDYDADIGHNNDNALYPPLPMTDEGIDAIGLNEMSD